MSENTAPPQTDALKEQDNPDIAVFSGMEPLLRKIPKMVRPGNIFFVKGSTPSGANRFTLNLQCNPEIGGRSGIPLHIDFRFNYKGTDYVVCNTLDGSWGPEDIYREMPLTRGQKFNIAIQCEVDHFKILINDRHFTNYKYRMALSTVAYLSALNDVTVTEVYFQQN